MFHIPMESLISFMLNGVYISYLLSCNLSSDMESRTSHIKITSWIRPAGHLAQYLVSEQNQSQILWQGYKKQGNCDFSQSMLLQLPPISEIRISWAVVPLYLLAWWIGFPVFFLIFHVFFFNFNTFDPHNILW